MATPSKPRPEYVWKFDINRRKYEKGSMGPPIWREHWGKHKIVGENRVSYLLEHGGGKVPKKPNDQTHVFDEAYLDELVWAHENRQRIREAIGWGNKIDAAKLRRIAAIIEEKPT